MMNIEDSMSQHFVIYLNKLVRYNQFNESSLFKSLLFFYNMMNNVVVSSIDFGQLRPRKVFYKRTREPFASYSYDLLQRRIKLLVIKTK